MPEQDGEDAAVPVGAVRGLEHIADGFLDAGPGVVCVESGPVVIERGPGKARELKQER
jgi:hypothetical protein